MAGEKRPFPFSDPDVQSIDISELNKKRQCLTSGFLKRKNGTVDTGLMLEAEKNSMDYENFAAIQHQVQNGDISFEDFQNGYDPNVVVRLKNRLGVHPGWGMHNGHNVHPGSNVNNRHSVQIGYSIYNADGVQPDFDTCDGNCQEMESSFQNGHSIYDGTMNNNNNNSVSSVCLRCQAGEPGHIGHIGR